jgi:hypothetical protein
VSVADKPVHATKTQTLLTAIEGLGTKNGLPIGIRTVALAAKTGVPANSIQMLLATHVASGRLCVCKVSVPGAPAQNEYRRGAGVPPPIHTPLKPARAGADIGRPAKPLPAAAPSAAAGTRPAPAPTPDASHALKKRAGGVKDSAGGAMRLSIDQDGTLQMGDADDPARWVFTPAQVLALGDFLHATQGVWRP